MDLILDYEMGDITNENFLRLFQHLINTGLAWKLQGHYGRTAQALLDNSRCTPAADAGTGAQLV